MAKRELIQLEKAMRARQLVRFSRRFEKTPVRGYVLDIGPRFFLLALVSDRLWFDGFECFRVCDVKNVRPDPYSEFAEMALKLRKEKKPKKLRISLSSIQEILSSANRAFPLITIHREKVDSGICWIGRVLKFDRGHVLMQEINPAAKWHKKPSKYRLSEITRVNFGGDYENALSLVARV